MLIQQPTGTYFFPFHDIADVIEKRDTTDGGNTIIVLVVEMVNPLSSYGYDSMVDSKPCLDTMTINVAQLVNPMFFQKLVLALKANHVSATEASLPMESLEQSGYAIEMITTKGLAEEDTRQVLGDIQGQLKRRDELLKARDQMHMIV